MEQELGRARRLLEQSEDSRESLVQQVEDIRGELLRTRAEKTALHRTQTEASQLSTQLHASHTEREGGRGQLQGSDHARLEREVAELRAQLHKASVRGEVEELKRALERKERENLRLSLQVKVRVGEAALGRKCMTCFSLEMWQNLWFLPSLEAF
ncbi:hypothetical protein ATANTOWER_017403 [Ataeniobius toweri]|uniref:Rootletin n=1 Tax=Ataeniobius toweri TaxID=208326 RepID=A0ABU7AFR7_9TELE|nr:hypothetical protein [Ataeniobius toweri]